MYADTLDNFAAVAEKKAAVIRRHPSARVRHWPRRSH